MADAHSLCAGLDKMTKAWPPTSPTGMTPSMSPNDPGTPAAELASALVVAPPIQPTTAAAAGRATPSPDGSPDDSARGRGDTMPSGECMVSQEGEETLGRWTLARSQSLVSIARSSSPLACCLELYFKTLISPAHEPPAAVVVGEPCHTAKVAPLINELSLEFRL